MSRNSNSTKWQGEEGNKQRCSTAQSILGGTSLSNKRDTILIHRDAEDSIRTAEQTPETTHQGFYPCNLSMGFTPKMIEKTRGYFNLNFTKGKIIYGLLKIQKIFKIKLFFFKILIFLPLYLVIPPKLTKCLELNWKGIF